MLDEKFFLLLYDLVSTHFMSRLRAQEPYSRFIRAPLPPKIEILQVYFLFWLYFLSF